MTVSLQDCHELPNSEYINLIEPQFEGQTRANSTGEYWMVFSSEGKFYKFKHNINS